MKKILFVLLLGAVIAVPSFSLASEFGSGPSYTLPAGQTAVGNMYAGGGTINLLGSVTKDVMVAGGNVLVAGTTSDNVMAVGGNVTLIGPVGQDARLAGGTVTLSGPIGGELVVAGGNVMVGVGTIVGGDAYLAGNQVSVDGGLLGSAKIYGQTVTLNGPVAKDLFIRAQKIVIGPKAIVGGNLNYQSAQPAQISGSAHVAGQTTFTKISMPERYSWGNTLAILGLSWLLKLIATLVAVLVAFFLFPRLTADFANRSAGNFWRELLRGLVILIVVPVVILILFVSVVGWILALLALFAYLLLLLLAGVMTVFTMSGVLQKYVFKKWGDKVTWQTLLISTLVIFILGLIPIIGWLVAFGFFLTSLGTLCKMQYDQVRRSDR